MSFMKATNTGDGRKNAISWPPFCLLGGGIRGVTYGIESSSRSSGRKISVMLTLYLNCCCYWVCMIECRFDERDGVLRVGGGVGKK